MYQNMLDFMCDYCSRTFTRKYNLQTHIENCHLTTTCFCGICDHKFGSPAGLHLHLLRGHNRFGKPYPECDICGRIFTRKQNIMSHMITVHLQGIGPAIRCDICSRSFTTERNLRRHNNLLHNPEMDNPTCDSCLKVFKGKQSLIAHIQAHHNVLFKGSVKCHLCGKAYTNNRNLKRHVEMFHGERGEFRCDVCPKVYTSNQSLKRHTKTRHISEDFEVYPCCYCDKHIAGKDNLESHISIYHQYDKFSAEYNDDIVLPNNNYFTCDVCAMNFDEESNLRQHIKTDHSFEIFYEYCRKSLLKQVVKTSARKSKNRLYNCEYCRHVYSNVYEFKNHMRANHDKEYSLSTCNVCFCKFYSKENMDDHKKICLPPDNVSSCNLCDKLFTDVSSLEFHTKIFHPQAQIADISSTILEDAVDGNSHKCLHCDRSYYSDRSLKHHVKLKHTSDQMMECQQCGKVCSNEFYLASHIKMVHENVTWSKCDYCDKHFKSKRNIRRHIEYTHLGMQRYKCVKCETLFKEKRSLRKHVRTKHPNSVSFPQCHICHKRFESAKSCKIHLKLMHSFNMNTYPCDLCSVSFSSNEALTIHFQNKHLAEDEIYKCERCNLIFKGQEKFEQHSEACPERLVSKVEQKQLPRCILCMKDFSTRKTLKRHIKKFHYGFNVDELANFGTKRRVLNVDCKECIRCINGDFYYNLYQNLKHLTDPVIFKCEACDKSYNSLEYLVLRYKMNYEEVGRGKMILSELCTAEMSEDEHVQNDNSQYMEPESTTNDIKVEVEDIKIEPDSP